MKKKYSILIVDDDKFLLEMYKKKFDQLGVTLDMSVGSNDALTKLRGGLTPDILVFDIIMPGIDGIELLETIRKEKLSPHSIVIMLTNESDSKTIERAKELRVQGYIVKATSVPSEVAAEVIRIADEKTK